MGVEAFMAALANALKRGLRLIQVREKTMNEGELRHFATRVVTLAREYKARVLINSDTKLASDIGADGVHLTSGQLQALKQRPQCDWVAASCHSRTEIEMATKIGADFVVAGPVAPTPTHPGAAVLGWDGFVNCAAGCAIPVYALGGMRASDLAIAKQAGAHGLAMLRGAWV
jgi:8-oxo-dGTP diphosphatase